jgi:flagellin-like protein
MKKLVNSSRKSSHNKKGISPLIASVVLIAVTLAIAGILTTWSVSFVGSKTSEVTEKAECGGALEIDRDFIKLSGSNLTFAVRNTKASLNLTNVVVYFKYADGFQSSFALASCCNFPKDLIPLGIQTVTVPTGKAEKPERIEAIASNCPEYKTIVVVP